MACYSIATTRQFTMMLQTRAVLVCSSPFPGSAMPTISPSIFSGLLPSVERVRSCVAEAHERFKSVGEGTLADYIPALASVPAGLFGVCLVDTSGITCAAGDAEYEFSIQSVSKPFVFSLICQ